MVLGYQYKRWTHRRTLQRSNSTNAGLTNVRLLQISDWYKRRNETNVMLVQTSDQYKRWTSTFIRKNVGHWLSLKKNHCYKKQIKNHSLIVIKSNKVSSFRQHSIKQQTKQEYLPLPSFKETGMRIFELVASYQTSR